MLLHMAKGILKKSLNEGYWCREIITDYPGVTTCVFIRNHRNIWSQKRRAHMTEADRSRGKPSQEKVLVVGFGDGAKECNSRS